MMIPLCRVEIYRTDDVIAVDLRFPDGTLVDRRMFNACDTRHIPGNVKSMLEQLNVLQ